MYVTISQAICLCCIIKVSEWKVGIFPKLVMGDCTFWTTATVGTCHQDLLWIITNKDSEDGMAPVPDPIPAHHFNTSFTNGSNWSQQVMHAEMKKVHLCVVARGLDCDALEFHCWNVAHQKLGTL